VVLRAPGTSSALIFPARETPAWIGDVDRDGMEDFALTEPQGVTLRSGRTGECLRTIASTKSGFGSSLAGGEDIDADEVPDVLVGTSSIEIEMLEAFSGATGRRIAGITGSFIDHLGTSLTFLGDVDGDGCADIAASSLWLGMEIHWGEVIVYSGRTQQILYRVHSPYLR
jgi:hypothetical protein